MTTLALRPRSGSEIVDAAVQLLRANYAPLITIAAITWLPVVLLQLAFRTELSDAGVVADHTGVFLLSSIMQTLALVVADAASVVIISDVHLGGETSASAALARVMPRLGTLIGANIMRNLIGGFALILLIVPGLYVVVRTFTLTAVVMCERGDSGESWGRAWALGENNVGRVFGPAATVGILSYVLAMALLYFTTRLGLAVPVLRASGVTLVVGSLGSVFFHPVVSVVRTLVYYDLRVRKEGFDVEVMANELGAPAVA
jgi:hypothetical protein